MFKKKTALKFLLALVLLVGGFLFVQNVFAQDLGTDVVGKNIALSAGDPRIIAAKIVRVALGFLGIIAVCIVLYGGFLWMTSAGNEETIGKAKKVLINGLIGLIIILMAFGITQFVLNSLLGRVDGGTGRGGDGPEFGQYGGALGNGIIESHYPPRGGTGIPRNTKIIVTFKEKMLLETLINNYDDHDTPENLADDRVIKNNNGTIVATPELPDPLADDWMEINSENVRIFKSSEGETAGEVKNYLSSDQVKVTFTPDLKNFVFDPIGLLGSPTENIWYTTALKPGLQFVDDRGRAQNAFAGAFSSGYAWDFEVSTIIDTTPPQVRTVVPVMAGDMDEYMEVFRACVAGGRSRKDCGAWARNVKVQINFSEAMDPTTVSGSTVEGVFDKILTTGLIKGDIPGTWNIGNQYRTIEFVTNDKCGTNSCGGDVFCLPLDDTIRILAKAARLGGSPLEAVFPYNGIVDVCGNSLDGDRDGEAKGPPVDNYSWSFETSDTIDLIPPRISAVTPLPGTGSVAFDEPINMTFTKLMSITSFTTSNLPFKDDQRDACAVWFYLEGDNLQEGGGVVVEEDDVAVRTRARIGHGDLLPTGGICSDELPATGAAVKYFPVAKSDVQDLFQNCFYEPIGPDEGSICVVGLDRELPAGCKPWE